MYKVPFILFLVLTTACSSNKNLNETAVFKIKLVTKYNNVFQYGEYIAESGDSAYIYYNNKYMLWMLPQESIVIDEKGVVTSKRILLKQYIHMINESYGIDYSASEQNKPVKSENKHLLENAIPRLDFYKYNTNNTLYSVKKSKNYSLIEEYVSKIKHDTTAFNFDTLRIFFSKKHNKTPYTLSKEYDSIKKAKVRKVDLVINCELLKNGTEKSKKTTLTWEIIEDPIPKPC